MPPARRLDAAGVEGVGDALQRRYARRLYLADDGRDVGGESVGLADDGLDTLECRLPLLMLSLGHGPTESFSTSAGGSERRLGAGGNLLALVLGNGGEQVDGELVGLGHVGCNEVHAAFHQAGNEMDVAGEPVELGDDELGFLAATCVERRGELGPVVALARLNLGELGDELIFFSFIQFPIPTVITSRKLTFTVPT